MKTITIEVTQQDIDSGIVENPECCPIALAARRAGLTGVRVEPNNKEVWELSFCYGAVLLPVDAVQFAEDFDALVGPVSPFSFDITVVD